MRLFLSSYNMGNYTDTTCFVCSDEPVDVEDLVRLGERGRVGGGCGPCPYFLSLDMYKKADIVFMPYNYVIDPGMRDVLGDRLKDAVVLLDEAHNIGEYIFGYFWLFLVIFGNLHMGNLYDVVFFLYRERVL